MKGGLREGGRERVRGGREEAMKLGRQRASVDEGRVERGGGRERARGGREEAMTLGRQRASVDEGRVEGGREGESKGREGGSHDARQAESVSG